MAQLGINPVYPPSEDMQVGDVYAFESHEDRLLAKRAFLGWRDVSTSLASAQEHRLKFAGSKLTEGGNEVALARGQIDARPEGLFAANDMSTFAVSSFPAIEVDSGLAVGLRGQPQGIGAIFGFAANRTLSMRLEFKSVTSYQISIPEGLKALRELCDYVDAKGKTYTHYCRSETLANWVNQKYQLVEGDHEHVEDAYPLIVTKVYLAREIVYTFEDAALAALAVAEVDKEGKIAPAPPMVSAEAMNKVVADGNADAIDATRLLITELNTNLRATDPNAGQGSSFSLAVVSESKIQIKQIFDRPLVIAYEGASFDGKWPPTQVAY